MGETDERHDIISEKWVTLDPLHPWVVFVDRSGEPYREGLNSFGYMEREIRIRAELASAAPAMVRALLKTEWRHLVGGKFCDGCPDNNPTPDTPYEPVFDRHSPGCVIDQALTAAGFPDQASRDAARRHLLSKAP
jgi:hypothetical protein